MEVNITSCNSWWCLLLGGFLMPGKTIHHLCICMSRIAMSKGSPLANPVQLQYWTELSPSPQDCAWSSKICGWWRYRPQSAIASRLIALGDYYRQPAIIRTDSAIAGEIEGRVFDLPDFRPTSCRPLKRSADHKPAPATPAVIEEST